MVFMPYSTDLIAKIKTIAGRRWHQDEQCWSAPHTDGALRHLQALFAGEPVEVEPSLRPVGVPGNQGPSPEPVSGHAAVTTTTLLEHVRQAIRTRHYSYRTEKAYIHWIQRFTLFHNKRHPTEMGEAEIGQFLSRLATDSSVSASTQNQALSALLCMYRKVIGKEIGYVNGVVRAKRPTRLPVVLTRQEVRGHSCSTRRV